MATKTIAQMTIITGKGGELGRRGEEGREVMLSDNNTNKTTGGLTGEMKEVASVLLKGLGESMKEENVKLRFISL